MATTYAEMNRRYKRFRKWYLSMSEEEQTSSLGVLVFNYIQHLDGQLKMFDASLPRYHSPNGNYKQAL